MLISSVDDPAFNQLCEDLASLGNMGNGGEDWPRQQLELCGQYGVYRWFLPPEFGGIGWSPVEIAKGYLQLSAACLTTTFVITQRTGACKRIINSQNAELQNELLPKLASGEIFATVGISHLTTSRRHLAKPVLQVRRDGEYFVLNGMAPWVTGGHAADYLVTGAVDDDGQQVLFALPSSLDGISIPPAFELIALNGSNTGRVDFQNVVVDKTFLLAGPTDNVLAAKTLAGETGAGGLQTSVLAVGLTGAVINYLREQSEIRDNLVESFESFESQHALLESKLLATISGDAEHSKDTLRQEANSLALRATQAAMVAAKGAGFVKGHPVGRWCQEAMFFLVWSCPQSVTQANLCEFAGLSISH